MKKTLLLLTAIVAGFLSQAQNELTVFSEDGETFVLHVNGVQVNQEAASRASLQNITGGMASVRIVFSDNIAPPLKKNLSFMDANTEIMAKLVMTKKGYKLRYAGETAIATKVIDQEEPEEVIPYETPDTEAKPKDEILTIREETVITETLGGDERIQMKIDVPGIKVDVGLNAPDLDMSETKTISTTTTTTTTSEGEGKVYVDRVILPDMDDYEVENDPCAIVTTDLSAIKAAIENEAFADDQVRVAKQSLRDRCITVEGLGELAELFSFEDDRLEFVTFAYDHTSDTQNFYQLNDAFTFSSSKEKLDEFLSTKQ